jgi:hypothetical protein
MSVLRLLPLAFLAMSQLAWLSTAAAQQPIADGPEFQVNTYTTDVQYAPAVASDAAGNFVVVWYSQESSDTDTSASSIQGQRYDASGVALGNQFQVNTYTTGIQTRSAVTTDGGGGFVVVWESMGSAGTDTNGRSIQGQRYDSGGTAVGGEFQVNSYTTGNQYKPAVAAEAAGSFVVVWESQGSAGTDTAGRSIQAQRYDGAGVAQGGQFQVNSYATSNQLRPSVAIGANGFLVAWDSAGGPGSQPTGTSIQAQRYDAAGVAQGVQFQVNSYTSANHFYSNVTAVPGGFIVVWSSLGSAGTDTDGSSIQARRFDGTGSALGTQFQVNSYTTGFQVEPGVTADAAGNFVVAWSSSDASDDAGYYSIHARRFDASGTPVDLQFQVNSYTTGEQRSAGVAGAPAGNFVVVWDSEGSAGSDSSNESVQAQRFIVPTTTSSTSTSSTTTSTLAPTDLLPGRIAIIKPATLAKFVAKPATGDTFAPPSVNPVAVGGSLRIFDTASTAGDDTYGLPAGSGWKGLGNPVGSKGYKYKGAGTPSDPCKVVLVKPTVIKGVCRGTGVALTPGFSGDVGIVLSLGATDRYCARFGGDEVRNDATLTKRKNAPAPGACP